MKITIKEVDNGYVLRMKFLRKHFAIVHEDNKTVHTAVEKMISEIVKVIRDTYVDPSNIEELPESQKDED
jgi:hypothetical protein